MEDGIVKTTDTEEAFSAMEESPDQTTETTTEPEAGETESTTEQVETPTEFDWSQYRGADNLKGRSVQDVIDHLNRTHYDFGQQSNELGRLRKIEADYKKIQEQISGQKEKPQEISEVQEMLYAKDLGEKPLTASMKHLVPLITEQVRKDILNNLGDHVTPLVEEKAQNVATQQELSQFRREHPDYEEFRQDMAQLMQPEYLGDEVPYEEAYKLAKLYREEPSIFQEAGMLMRQGIPFDNAKEYASLKQQAAANAETKRQQLKKEVEEAGPGIKRTGTKQAVSGEKIVTMDDAFAAD